MSLLLAAGEHGHLDLGVSLGSLALRVVLLAAVPVVAGFAMLRGFLGDPGRFATVAVMGVAATAASMELLLAGGLNLPEQVVPLLLAAIVLPMYLIRSRDERFAAAVRLGRGWAPLVFAVLAVLAAVQFGIAWFAGAGQDRTATVLHTGVLLGLVALVWFAVAHPPRPAGRPVTVATRAGAALLAMALLAGTAQAVTMRPPDPVPGMATTARVELGAGEVDALVVPNLPGWNLLHVGTPAASAGTDEDDLRPVRALPGTTGGWLAIELPAGRGDVWVRDAGGLDSFTTDTGAGDPAPRSVTGPDGPECASAMLGGMLASGTASGAERCPSEYLDPLDAASLRELVDSVAARGHRRVAFAGDASPRGLAAARAVRAAAIARDVELVPPGEDGVPLLLATGWAGADPLLRRVADGVLPADGTYLAPWLFTDPLLAIDAGQHVDDPAGESFRRYRFELGDDYPGQPASAAGYRAWLAERGAPSTVD